MANELAAQLTPDSLIAEAGGNPSGGVLDPFGNLPVSSGAGMGFGKLQTGASLIAFRVPATVLLATGLTVELLVADDPNNPNAGAAAVFGVTVGPITSGTSTYDDTTLASSTEVTGTVTIPSTAKALKVLSIAVPIADMNSLAAANWALIRIRRLGTNSSDTHRGRVVLLGADVRNT